MQRFSARWGQLVMARKIYYPLIALLMLASCRSYRHVYSPSPAINPFFKASGDNQFAACYSGGGGGKGSRTRDKNEGFDIQGAYAISDHVALTGTYYSRAERDLYNRADQNFYTIDYFDTSTVNYKRKLFDIGVGYFTPIDKNKTIFFNLYGGVGFGNFSIADHGIASNTLNPYTRSLRSDMVKWYVQPSFNFFPGKYVRIGVISKFSFVHYNSVHTDYTADEQSFFGLDKLGDKGIGFFEPSVNLQFGIPNADWLKIESSVLVSAKWKSDFPVYRRVNASIGVVVSPFKMK